MNLTCIPIIIFSQHLPYIYLTIARPSRGEEKQSRAQLKRSEADEAGLCRHCMIAMADNHTQVRSIVGSKSCQMFTHLTRASHYITIKWPDTAICRQKLWPHAELYTLRTQVYLPFIRLEMFSLRWNNLYSNSGR